MPGPVLSLSKTRFSTQSDTYEINDAQFLFLEAHLIFTRFVPINRVVFNINFHAARSASLLHHCVTTPFVSHANHSRH